MLAAVKFGELNAVVKCRAARLPEPSAYLQLLKAGTHSEQMRILQNFGVPVPPDGSLPTKQFLITNWLAPDYEAVLRRVKGSAQALIQSLLARLELENVKYVLRTVVREEKVDRQCLLALGKNASVRTTVLAKIQGIVDFLQAVERTVFAGPIRAMASHMNQPESLLSTEMALDRAVYNDLRSHANQFKGPGAIGVLALLEKFLTVMSLLWVVRYRQCYDLSKEAVLGIGPVSQPFQAGLLKKVAESTTLDGLRGQMWASPQLTIWAQGQTLITWEISLWRQVARAAKRALYGPPFKMAVSLGFLLLKELAVRDLATICQSKILGIPALDIRPLLVHLAPAEEA